MVWPRANGARLGFLTWRIQDRKSQECFSMIAKSPCIIDANGESVLKWPKELEIGLYFPLRADSNFTVLLERAVAQFFGGVYILFMIQ